MIDGAIHLLSCDVLYPNHNHLNLSGLSKLRHVKWLFQFVVLNIEYDFFFKHPNQLANLLIKIPTTWIQHQLEKQSHKIRYRQKNFSRYCFKSCLFHFQWNILNLSIINNKIYIFNSNVFWKNCVMLYPTQYPNP